jgi:hypothetical protein
MTKPVSIKSMCYFIIRECKSIKLTAENKSVRLGVQERMILLEQLKGGDVTFSAHRTTVPI